MEDAEEDSADLGSSSAANGSYPEQRRNSVESETGAPRSDSIEDRRTSQALGSEASETSLQDRDQGHPRIWQESTQPGQEPVSGQGDVAPWSTEAAEALPAGGQAQAAESLHLANGASKEKARRGGVGKDKAGPAEGKEGDKPRWGIGNKKGLDKTMAKRSFNGRDLSPAKGDVGGVWKAGAPRRPSKNRDVSPVITRADQKEVNRQRLAERQKEEKQLLEKRLAAKNALLQSIKENLKNEVASQQLSAYLEKKRAQRERWYLKRYGRLPAHRLDVEVSAQLLPAPATGLLRHPPAPLSLRKGVPSGGAPLHVSLGSPAASLSGSSQPGSPSRPPWNGSPKVAPSEYSSEGGSPLGKSAQVAPLPAPTLQPSFGRAKQPKGSPKAAGAPKRAHKTLLDTDTEMQVLKAVRRREELLGRLRTLLLARADDDDTRVPHSSAVSSCLDSLRMASLDAVEAVQAWCAEQGHVQRPFVWAGQDYLAKMNTDLGNLLHKEAGVHAWLGFDIWLDPFCTGLLPSAAPPPPPGAERYVPAMDGSQALRVKAALNVLADAAGSTAQLTKQRVALLGSPSRGNRDLSNKQPLGSPTPSQRPSSHRPQEETNGAAPEQVELQDSRTSDLGRNRNLLPAETRVGTSGAGAAETTQLNGGGGHSAKAGAAVESRGESAEGPRMAGTEDEGRDAEGDRVGLERESDVVAGSHDVEHEAKADSAAVGARSSGFTNEYSEERGADGFGNEADTNGAAGSPNDEPLAGVSPENLFSNGEITYVESSSALEASRHSEIDESFQGAPNVVPLQERRMTPSEIADINGAVRVSSTDVVAKGPDGLQPMRMSTPEGTSVGTTLDGLLTEVAELEERDH